MNLLDYDVGVLNLNPSTKKLISTAERDRSNVEHAAAAASVFSFSAFSSFISSAAVVHCV